MKDTIIIEFVGPPGAGKTVSSNCFARSLRNKHFTVLTKTDLIAAVRNFSLFQKALLVVQLFVLRLPRLIYYTASLASYQILSYNAVYRYVRLNIFDLALHKLIKTKNIQIVLLDQWIIQELWSATIFRLQSYTNLRQQLSKFYFKTDFVFYFDIDLTTAADRIKHRSTNASRFDRFDDERRMKELQAHSKYLFQLYQGSDCENKYIISGKDTLEKNTEVFSQRIAQAFYHSPFSLS